MDSRLRGNDVIFE